MGDADADDGGEDSGCSCGEGSRIRFIEPDEERGKEACHDDV